MIAIVIQLRYTRVFKKVLGQSDLRQHYFLLCRMAYVLINDYQMKKKYAQNHRNLIFFSDDTEVFTLHELDLRITISYFHDVSVQIHIYAPLIQKTNSNLNDGYKNVLYKSIIK